MSNSDQHEIFGIGDVLAMSLLVRIVLGYECMIVLLGVQIGKASMREGQEI